MKTKLTMLAVLSAVALAANAQDNNPGPGEGRPPGGPGMNGNRPPPNPLMMALDVNHDRVIDASEIANASAALKTLDKNGDGKLTEAELRPARPQHPPNDGGDASQGPPPGQ